MDYLLVEGRQINLRRQGAGQAVICLHSSSSHSGQFKPLINLLAPKYTVLAPDVHGFGRSAALPRDGQAWYVHDLKIVEALLQRQDGRVHLVGHSLGGALAFMSALRWPDRIASLTMIEPVLFMLLDQAKHPAASEGHQATALVVGNLFLHRQVEAARAFMDFWSGKDAFDAAPEHVRDYVTGTIDRVADDWAGMVPGLPGAPRLEDIAKVKIPTALICGGETRQSARAIVEMLYADLPQSKLIEIPGAGHMAAATTPDLINPHIVAFVQSQTGGHDY